MTPKKIKLAEDTISRGELASLCDWIQEGNQLTKGALTLEFERAFANALGVEHAVFVNSGSSANLLATYAHLFDGRLSGRRVIAPAISWVTTVSPLIQFGMEVHLCDCDPRNLGFDIGAFERLCREVRPDLAVGVHVLGHPNEVEELLAICEQYGVILIEDACEALGTVVNGRHLGTYGDAGTFSFYFGHQMSTIEGGMVVCHDSDLADTLRSLRAHGWARDVREDTRAAWEKEHEIDVVRSLYTFYYPGFNCRSTDLNAFLGLGQIKQLDDIVSTRQRNHSRYEERLSGRFWTQQSQVDRLSSFAFGTLVENREEVFRHLEQNAIEARPLVCGNIGRQPFWQKMYGVTSFEHADVVHDKGLYLPNHRSLTLEDVDRVADVLLAIGIPASFDDEG